MKQKINLGLGPRVMPWERQNGCHNFVSNLAYIGGAKFEQHHSSISRDILDFVIYLCTETICDNARKYSK